MKRKIFNKKTLLLINAVASNILFGFPAKKIRVIGVTGTSGKTTTCHFISKILETAGEKVGLITSLDYDLESLSAFKLQKILKKMVSDNYSYVVIEAHSTSLEEYRLWGVPFYVAVFTNLGHAHLNYHGSMSNYLKAKEKLFALKPFISVLNADDSTIDRLSRFDSNKLVTYAVNNSASLVAKKIYARTSGVDFILLLDGRQTSVSLPLPGEFNVYNALAAIGVGLALGNSLDVVMEGVRRIEPIAGRMEVINLDQPYTVIIDYANTPDALQKVYETILPSVRGKLIAVVGADGGAKPPSRPVIGSIAGRYADYVIVTSQDSQGEDPLAIIDEVASGVPRGRPKGPGRLKLNKESDIPIKYKDSGEDIWWWRVPDRKEAIAKALELARPQDVVIVTGRGASDREYLKTN